ncbi:UrcA family protein [Phenylobacterium sp.]|uniref:UrcA family protein n=1 Tax=Phenylobacterium sp. TaxID=1871053 RepID=UPI002632CB25|nr:UrcA family protein [Phenylobacterium sp.]
MKKLALIAAVAAASLSCAPIATAQTARPIVVKYGDLNLRSEAGRAAFQARLASGVSAFCGPAASIMDVAGQQRRRACVKEATEKTFASLQKADSRFAGMQTPIVLADR